ncbi:protein Mpv17 [Leptopilina boulardi]|uniref:protein Mpv17 n=1 Tax=Leptopilina boulardi TaxID=63433 RepID=UPI0021F5D83E|nr:protein Mpv17 [Leptopilina boulardi]
MSYILRVYQKLLSRFPLGMQAVQAGTLMALGDQIAQNLVEKRTFDSLDFKRTAGFAGIGFFLAGPATRTWYGILDKYIGSKGGIVTLKKVAFDQLLFAPVFLCALIVVIGILQGNEIDNIKLKLKNEYPDILVSNYKLWPAVQLLNFGIVPLQYQVLVVQTVALLWNTYISYRTNRDKN